MGIVGKIKTSRNLLLDLCQIGESVTALLCHFGRIFSIDMHFGYHNFKAKGRDGGINS